jgi:hypothetical protein
MVATNFKYNKWCMDGTVIRGRAKIAIDFLDGDLTGSVGSLSSRINGSTRSRARTVNGIYNLEHPLSR